jgi:predicted transcriptional regulator/transcriptional regulator with XRE-family HTH domain
MSDYTERKLFLGGRLRRLRRDLGVTQARMAEDIGVSPSYLNLLERNQRPVTAQVLLKLADAYELDLRSFSNDSEAGGSASLTEVFSDPLFKDLALPRQEITELSDNSPAVAEAVVRLYQAYSDRRRRTELGAADLEGGEGAGLVITPSDWVRDHIQHQRNHFAELEEVAERLCADLATHHGESPDLGAALRERLLARFGVKVSVTPAEVLPDMLRRYDYHRKRLFLSEMLPVTGRLFGMAYQLAMFEGSEALTLLLDRAGAPDRPTRSLLKVSLGNYLAAAILMPYGLIHEAAEKSGYDIDLLTARFGVSVEQVCHRLTTLTRTTQRGVPFFMLRVDSAGNISKRFAGGAFPFSRFGGACPRWNLHSAFRTPGRFLTQIVETQDGARYFTMARTVARAANTYTTEDSDVAIGMGCELKHAAKLVYARGLDLDQPRVTPIGPACRICERPACPQRATEPISRTLLVDDFSKTISPYPFAPG